MKTISNGSIDKILKESNLNEPQRVLIKEIISTSKISSPTNKRYSDNWILLCILLLVTNQFNSIYFFSQ